jgi:phage protein D
MIRVTGIAIVGALLLAVGACSERPQVAQYKQGTYQGKPDTPPYQNAQFNGDKTAWDKAIATRAQAQNEYKRTN